MKSVEIEFEPVASVDSVLITHELNARRPRLPDYVAEHSAFTALAREISTSSCQLANRLCELAIALCGAGSAGISLLSTENSQEVFHWIALAGAYESYVGGTTSRGFSPCGTCLERESPQLYSYPERYFTFLAEVEPPIVEGLVVPFRASGRDLGTIWVVSHDETHRGFDSEDVRILQSLGDFAALALEQVQLREAVQDSEQRLRRTLDALGLPVYTTDASGRILHYNEAAAALWGREPEIGKDLWCGSWRIYRPDGTPLPLEHCPMAVTLSENRPVRDVEILVERPDGTRSAILPYPSPLNDASGRLIGAVNVLVDITKLRKAEEAEARLAAIVESSQDAIVSKNLDGIVTSWNQAAEHMFGYVAEEAIGQSIRIIIPDDRQDEEDGVLDSVRRGEKVEHFETVRRRKDGTTIDISLSVSPVRNTNNQIIGASKVARDISDRKEAEAAVKRALEVKDQFLGLVSHELRTPISTILGNGQILLRREGDLPQEDKLQALQDIVSGALKLEENIEHLLILTRLDSSQLAIEPLSLPVIVRKVIESFSVSHPTRDVSLYCEGDIPCGLGQETLVALVLQNLLTNADKYSPPDLGIEVRLKMNDFGQPEIHVLDQGIGLDEQDQANLFTPFYRSPKARNRATGMGLGLAVCKRAMEAQGGIIGVNGRPKGGSDFFFSLQSVMVSD